MTLPASLVSAIEAHPCFTGCYRHESPVTLCIDPAVPTVATYQAACEDCLMYRVGGLASVLPPGMSQYTLAQELSAHMRALRGYRWAISGYHARGPGFWLSAASFGDGLLLADASRNHNGSSDLDLLIEAFRLKVAQPDDSGMLDPALWTAEVVYLDLSMPLGIVRSKQDILASPQCSLVPRQGHRRVSVLEFLPLAQAALGGGAMVADPPESPASPLQPGDVCPACGAEVMERPLFTGSWVGCLCG